MSLRKRFEFQVSGSHELPKTQTFLKLNVPETQVM